MCCLQVIYSLRAMGSKLLPTLFERAFVLNEEIIDSRDRSQTMWLRQRKEDEFDDLRYTVQYLLSGKRT
jgi:hypothetical protein